MSDNHKLVKQVEIEAEVADWCEEYQKLFFESLSEIEVNKASNA